MPFLEQSPHPGIDSNIPGGTDKAIDIDNPANLGQESTDAGAVKNLKWRFSDSKTRQLPGGWVREQVITDLPASHDIAGAQQHLTKNSIREMHWHRVAEWGYVYHGQIAVSAVDEDGRNQVEVLNVGDIWYFPKGEAHVIQGLADQNEYLLVFDDGDFEAPGTSFNVDDWIAHTPKDILAKSLGESFFFFPICSTCWKTGQRADKCYLQRHLGIDPSLLASVPSPNPYILKTNLTGPDLNIASPYGKLEGNSSYVFKASEIAAEEVPGGGGTVKTVDSRNFPVAKTIASSIVTLKPGALRELHWHPNVSLMMMMMMITMLAIGGIIN
jgi:oxalate decarboxylase